MKNFPAACSVMPQIERREEWDLQVALRYLGVFPKSNRLAYTDHHQPEDSRRLIDPAFGGGM
jgi:hypothetical protein